MFRTKLNSVTEQEIRSQYGKD